MTGFLENVLRGTEALAARDPVGTLPDADLLRRFTGERDEAAFAVLVRRHGPLVWGVCRNLLPRDADAEDAFQATFLALVRGANGVRQTAALGGWLHGVAYRIAMKVRRTAARRKRRETVAAVDEADTPVADAAWDELQAAVHEEVCRLPDKLRLPFVLCSLQGLSRQEAAAQVGWTVGSVSVRLSQARRRLLDRLARRGVPAAAVATGVAGTAGVPSALFAVTFRTAMAPDRASPAVLSLARGVPLMARTKLIVAGVLLAGALTTGLGTRLLSTADAQAPVTRYGQPEAPKAGSQPAVDRWEYRFVPTPKAPSAEELSKLLASYGRDHWEYCGSQNLMTESGGKAAEVSHLAFKRARLSTAALDEVYDLYEKLKPTDPKADTKEKELYRKAISEAQQAYEALLKERDLSRKQAITERDRAAQAEAERARAQEAAVRAEREARARAQAEALARADAEVRAVEQQKLAVAAKVAAEENALAQATFLKQANSLKTAQEKIAVLETELQKARAQAEHLAKRLADLEAAGKKPDDPKLVDPKPGAEKSVLKIFRLKHASADALSKTLQTTFAKSDVRIVPDPGTNSLLLNGTEEGLIDVAKVIEELDRPKD